MTSDASRRPRALELTLIRAEASLRDALVSLDRSSCQVVIVEDAGHRAVGLLTDGDIRRALLKGASLDAPVAPIMRQSFTSVGPEARRADVLDLMQALRIGEVPVLGASGELIGLHLMHDILGRPRRENWAVVMAGGRGTRLAPLTDALPKPMLRVAGRPILERIVLQLVGAGISRVFLSVHYLAQVIEDHFGNGERFGCRIDYLREERPLGTAGALALLPEEPRSPLLVMNGDLMTQADIGALLDHHERRRADATVAVRRYLHTVPFGCVELDGDRVTGIEEKPTLEKVVNAGIYVIAPALLQTFKPGAPSTMPELLGEAIAAGRHVAGWEVEDDWIDVGQREQLEKARGAW